MGLARRDDGVVTARGWRFLLGLARKAQGAPPHHPKDR